MVEAVDSREILMKAYERLLPAIGYLHSPVAGFAATVIVFTTWAARKLRGEKINIERALWHDEQRLVDIERELRRLYETKRLLEKALAEAGDPRRASSIKARLDLVEERIRRLEEERELVDMRIMAIEKLVELKEEGVLKKLDKLVEDLEKGRVSDDLLEAIVAVEKGWRDRQLTSLTIRRLLGVEPA